MRVPIVRGESHRDFARTGAPAIASTVLIPTVRSSVLFPDMLDPLMRMMRVELSSVTELRMHFAAAKSGWPSSSPEKKAAVPLPDESSDACATWALAALAETSEPEPLASKHAAPALANCGNGSAGCSNEYV